MEHFKGLGLDNVTAVAGNFDDTLAHALALVPSPDLVFFDGNHRYAPTLRYFHQCLEHAGEDAVFIFDDIHWSREMEDAWAEIILSSRVTCSIDLFFVGVVFFRKGFRERQHFTIRY
jgi:predicted O-methyltransferase YrrM